METINLNMETIKVPREDSYNVDDLERMFGKRIRRAINNKPNKNGRIYKAVIIRKMAKMIKPWKFWNKDIREAYKNYVGPILVPWVIKYEEPVIICDPSVEKYYKKKIDITGKYTTIKIGEYD